MKGDDAKCFEAGMDDYLAKPVNKSEMQRMLVKWLAHKVVHTPENSSEENSQNPTIAAKESVMSMISTRFEDTLIDAEAFDTISELLEDKFPDFLKQYIRNNSATLRRAYEAAENNDFQTLYDITHTMKSSSGSLGAIQLVKHAEEIEEAAKDAITQKTRKPPSLLKEVQHLQDAFNALSIHLEAELKELEKSFSLP